MWTKEVRIEDGKYSVSALIVRCGRDVILTVGGGELPHVGASAQVVPRPSLQNPEEISASVSVLCVSGHKEDEFARVAAGRITAKFNCVTCVSVGVHIDSAQKDELLRLQKNLDGLLSDVISALESAPL